LVNKGAGIPKKPYFSSVVHEREGEQRGRKGDGEKGGNQTSG
jgi:hypothetical protein